MKNKSGKRFYAFPGGIVAVGSAYAFILYEWFFQFTKVSFLDSYSLLQTLSVPLIVPLFLLPFTGVTVFPFIVLSFIRHRDTFPVYLGGLALLAPTIVTAAMFLLIIDNFTYTLWKFNAGSFQGVVRYAYAILFIDLIFLVFIRFVRWTSGSELQQPLVYKSVAGLILLSLCVGWIAKVPYYPREKVDLGIRTTADELPDIIIFSTDGLDAKHLPVYGYGRDTTPFIKSLAAESLIFNNAFSNGSHTTAAVGSLFTGKLPTRTHMIYPPDMFKGKDSYQHLPGILRELGYKTADVSIRHYADPYDRGLNGAFDIANGRSFEKRWCWIKFLMKHFPLQTFFWANLVESLSNKLSHIFGMQNYFNAYLAVVGLRESHRYFPDADNMQLVMDFLEKCEKGPVFLHVHLLGTHGPYFKPNIRYFSVGQKQTKAWMKDFYDDSILDFDAFTQKLVERLKQVRRYQNSIFIVTSDHGSKWTSLVKIPLILRFPYGRIRGVRDENVQYIDLAPTILNFLGQPVPDWMEGHSLFDPSLTNMRPIISAQPAEWGSLVDGWRNVARYAPPFYSLGGISMIIGDRWYNLNVLNGKIKKGKVIDHTGELSNECLPPESQVRKMLIDHLSDCGYNITTLR